MIIAEVISQDSAQVIFTDDDQMIETLSANRADDSFRLWIRPGAPRRRDDFLDLHSRHSQPKLFVIDLVTISKQEARGGLVRESLDDLLRGPRRLARYVM